MHSEKTQILIQKLRVPCRVGVPVAERNTIQIIEIDITCDLADAAITADDISVTVDYAKLVERVSSLLASKAFVLLEVMAEALAELCFKDSLVDRVTIRLLKPHKVSSCEAVGIERSFRRKDPAL